MKILAISGTPGVGKSSVGKKLSEVLGVPMIELSQVVIEKKLYTEFDEERQSYVIDEDRVRNFVAEYYRLHGPYVLVSHYAEIAPRDVLELIVVLRYNPRKLIDRLRARGWSSRKVAENVEAELLGISTRNAVEEHGEEMVVEIDATGKSVDDVVNEVLSIVFGEEPRYLGPSIDWFQILDENELEEVLKFVATNT